MNIFMQILAHAPANVRFEAFGSEPKQSKYLVPPSTPAISAPRRRGKRKRAANGKGAKEVLLDYLVARKEPVRFMEIRKHLADNGYAVGTASSQLSVLKSKGLIKSPKQGYAQATTKASSAVGVDNNAST
ncbi:MAG: hypothetical protein ACJ8CB_17450 [Ktedonobacteraceae bacterium]